ncbi:MAG: DctP family TRAP transporter solute-binding subunit [Deltaproteobacteria bacterium]|jgi:tripartite ATP-independent transporter DctP family solute receptor|nr:DctP family TRAP transporter solute-binding subunit [Deltaproteobacteria bacterium]
MRAKSTVALAAMLAALLAPATPCLADVPAAAQDPPAKLTLRAAQVLLPGHPIAKGLEYMGFLLEERSGGELSLDIRESTQIKGERDLIEDVQMGELDLIVITTGPLYGFSNDFLVFDLPYAFPDALTARRVLDGPFGEKSLQNALQVGLVGLTYFENGLRHVTTTRKPVSRPEDLKGLKIRTMESRIHMEVFRTLGATPVPLAFGDLYARLKDGAVDGQENPISVIVTTSIFEVQRDLTLTGHFYMPAPVFVSAGVWNKLSDRQRDLLRTAARDAMHYHRAVADRFMGPEQLRFLGKSMDVNESPDLALWREAVVGPVRERFRAEIGPQVIEELDREIERVTYEGGPAAAAEPTVPSEPVEPARATVTVAPPAQ